MLSIVTQNDLLEFIRQELTEGKNLSIRGVAELCGVSHPAIITSGNIRPTKLAETLTQHGFDGGNLTQHGFPAKAVWLTIEYFAWDSKAEAPMAKQIARTFGMLGVLQTFEEVTKPTQSQMSQLEMIAGLAQEGIRLEKKQQELERKQLEHEQRLAQIEAEKLAAEDELSELPLCDEPAKEMPVRARINLIARNKAQRDAIAFRAIWNKLYSELYYRYSYDVKARCRNSGRKYLDQIECDDMMEKLYAIASEVCV